MAELKRLLALQAVMATRSVTGAARQLHQTPSAVSQHIAALEREVGTPLFARVGRRLVPTRAAIVLNHHAAPVLQYAHHFDAALNGLRASAADVVRVGVTRDSAAALFAAAAAGGPTEWADRLEVHESRTPHLRRMLDDGLLDIVIADELVPSVGDESNEFSVDVPMGVAGQLVGPTDGQPGWVVADSEAWELIAQALSLAHPGQPVSVGPSYRTTLLLAERGRALTVASALHVAAAGVEVAWASDPRLALRHRVSVDASRHRPVAEAESIAEALRDAASDALALIDSIAPAVGGAASCSGTSR